MIKSRKAFVVAGIGFSSMLALVPLGCSGGGGGGPSSYAPKGEATQIAAAGKHVFDYLAENQGKLPKNTGEMKDWAAKKNIPEDVLLSTRDHEPYQIHEVGKGRGKQVIIVETTGEKGKKFMFSRRQGPGSPVGTEATQEQIDSALHPAASGTGRPG